MHRTNKITNEGSNQKEMNTIVKQNFELTNLKNRGNKPNGPKDANGKPKGGGHCIHFDRGTAIGSQLVRCGCF